VRTVIAIRCFVKLLFVYIYIKGICEENYKGKLNRRTLAGSISYSEVRKDCWSSRSSFCIRDYSATAIENWMYGRLLI
jgi:hypothetical protein